MFAFVRAAHYHAAIRRWLLSCPAGLKYLQVWRCSALIKAQFWTVVLLALHCNPRTTLTAVKREMVCEQKAMCKMFTAIFAVFAAGRRHPCQTVPNFLSQGGSPPGQKQGKAATDAWKTSLQPQMPSTCATLPMPSH